jgi:broad specificity phosphatase PhoE
MSGPLEIVLQRHGFTEANAAQRADKLKRTLDEHEEIYARHDSDQRLAEQTVGDALVARGNLAAIGLDPSDYDERFVSVLLRAIESALEFGPDCEWLPSMALIERDWGASGATPKARRDELFPESAEQLRRSPFYGRHHLGESVYDLYFRIRDWIDVLHREHGRQRVWAMAHGETMSATMCVIERWLPWQWEAFESDPTMSIANWSVLQYSRVNPEDPSIIVESMSSGWRRMYDPINPALSPFGGQWVRLGGKRRLDARRMRELVDARPRLVTGSLPEEVLPAARAQRALAERGLAGPDQPALPS